MALSNENVYKSKTNELKAESANVDESLAQLGDVDPTRGELALLRKPTELSHG
jgi:hypothetical protein